MIWRSAAEADLTDAYLHIGAGSPDAADRLLDAVGEAVLLLLENPRAGRPCELGSPRANGIRPWSPSAFPNHLISYRVRGEDIEVVRLLHGARDLPRLLGPEA